MPKLPSFFFFLSQVLSPKQLKKLIGEEVCLSQESGPLSGGAQVTASGPWHFKQTVIKHGIIKVTLLRSFSLSGGAGDAVAVAPGRVLQRGEPVIFHTVHLWVCDVCLYPGPHTHSCHQSASWWFSQTARCLCSVCILSIWSIYSQSLGLNPDVVFELDFRILNQPLPSFLSSLTHLGTFYLLTCFFLWWTKAKKKRSDLVKYVERIRNVYPAQPRGNVIGLLSTLLGHGQRC